ncbi:hypothetical protein [uncultured Desulfobacter sp.]|nr:hypothetical protein [uncultured Desulfobacter sp.]
MDIEVLRKYVSIIRKVLEAHNKDINENLFGKFPYGACGNTTGFMSEWLQ